MALGITRKEGQQIWIGEALVTFVKLRNNKATIGIEAPAHIRLLRAECVGTEPKEKRDEYTRLLNKTRASGKVYQIEQLVKKHSNPANNPGAHRLAVEVLAIIEGNMT